MVARGQHAECTESKLPKTIKTKKWKEFKLFTHSFIYSIIHSLNKDLGLTVVSEALLLGAGYTNVPRTLSLPSRGLVLG